MKKLSSKYIVYITQPLHEVYFFGQAYKDKIDRIVAEAFKLINLDDEMKEYTTLVAIHPREQYERFRRIFGTYTERQTCFSMNTPVEELPNIAGIITVDTTALETFRITGLPIFYLQRPFASKFRLRLPDERKWEEVIRRRKYTGESLYEHIKEKLRGGGDDIC